MGIHVLDFVSRVEILQRARKGGIVIWPLEIIIRMRRLLYVGRILRQDDKSILKVVLLSELMEAHKEKHDGTETMYRHCISKDLKLFGISDKEWKMVPRKSESEWVKIVEKGRDHCFQKWLLKRDEENKKRDAILTEKMSHLVTAIERGDVLTKRGKTCLHYFDEPIYSYDVDLNYRNDPN